MTNRAVGGLIAAPRKMEATVTSVPSPISILTGFLGSGKTTLLRRVLADPAFVDTAVLVNEFGAVGLDHLILRAVDPDVVLLPSGCVCCVVREDLARSLHDLLRRRSDGALPPFRRLVLETSGLAEPAPILHTLSADAYLEHMLRLDTVVTTVDAVAAAVTLEQYQESVMQAACADRLVFTKTDIASPPAGLRERLAALNPMATQLDGRDAAAAAILFGGGTGVPPRRNRFAATVPHTHGIESRVILLRRPMTRLEFAMALGGLARERGEDLLRVKGLVAFADRDGPPAVIHAVRHTLYPPDWLDAWPDEDHTNRLVFITRGISQREIADRFVAGDPVDAESTKPIGVA